MTGRFAALLSLWLLVVPAVAGELRVALPGREGIVLDLPDGWRGQSRQTRPDLPPTIAIASASPGAFQMLVTPIWPAGAGAGPTAPELLRLVRGAADQARAQAVEPELKVRELSSSGHAGYYFSATDRQPEPSGYKYLTQGALALNELRITFTILVNGDPEEPTAQALAMLRSLRRSPAPGAR